MMTASGKMKAKCKQSQVVTRIVKLRANIANCHLFKPVLLNKLLDDSLSKARVSVSHAIWSIINQSYLLDPFGFF